MKFYLSTLLLAFGDTELTMAKSTTQSDNPIAINYVHQPGPVNYDQYYLDVKLEVNGTRSSERRSTTGDLKCVYDQCPAIYMNGVQSGSSSLKINGVYLPQYVDCSDPQYGKGTYNALWWGYRNENGATFGWYWKDKSFRGWSAGVDSNIRYYDGYNRNMPTEIPLSGYVARKSYGSSPAPQVQCLTNAVVTWYGISSNPTAKFEQTDGSSYSDTQSRATKEEASLGVKAYGVSASNTFTTTTQSVVQQTLDSTTKVSCKNPCGDKHYLYAEAIDFQSTGSMFPACGKISCVPLSSGPPRCPWEYCGGDSIMDGCQCCISNDWAADSKDPSLPPICEKKY